LVVLLAHSLMLTHPLPPTPLPEYPEGQVQVFGAPGRLLQVAIGEVSQPPLALMHSLTSVQVTPSPV
jgi:hypothetical protein